MLFCNSFIKHWRVFYDNDWIFLVSYMDGFGLWTFVVNCIFRCLSGFITSAYLNHSFNVSRWILCTTNKRPRLLSNIRIHFGLQVHVSISNIFTIFQLSRWVWENFWGPNIQIQGGYLGWKWPFVLLSKIILYFRNLFGSVWCWWA